MPRAKGDVQLAIGYWIVSHKQTLQKWWAISLLAFIVFSLIWILVFFSLFFHNQSQDDALVLQAASRLGRLTAGVHGPADLTIGQVTILPRDHQHLDAVAWAENPNADWGAVAVRYHWLIGDTATNSETVFINPSSKRPLIGLNLSAAGSSLTSSVVLDDVEWTRVGRASLPAATFMTEGLVLTPTTVTAAGQTVSTVSLRATVTNRSVYNFYHVTVPVVMLAGDRIAAIDVLTYDRWPTLTGRTITDSWPYAISGATTAQILPQVSQFDLENTYR